MIVKLIACMLISFFVGFTILSVTIHPIGTMLAVGALMWVACLYSDYNKERKEQEERWAKK